MQRSVDECDLFLDHSAEAVVAGTAGHIDEIGGVRGIGIGDGEQAAVGLGAILGDVTGNRAADDKWIEDMAWTIFSSQPRHFSLKFQEKIWS